MKTRARRKRKKVFELCLCHRCESNFIESGYVVIKKGWQEVKEECDFCRQGSGVTFGIFQSKK